MTLGYVYKLYSDEGRDIYIGSTTNLKKRFNKHKTDRKCMSRILFEKYSDVKFEILELIEYQFKVDMLNLEKKHIKLNKEFVVNKLSPIRTLEEKKDQGKKNCKKYNFENKDDIKEYKKKYYLDNKNELDEYKKKYNLENKEKINEIARKSYLNRKLRLNDEMNALAYNLDKTTIVSGIICKLCKNELPSHSMEQHLNGDFNKVCPH